MLNNGQNDSTYIGQSRVDTIVIGASRIDTIVISRTDTIYVKNDGGEAEDDLSQLKAVDLGLSVKWASANVGVPIRGIMALISHGARRAARTTIRGIPTSGMILIPHQISV